MSGQAPTVNFSVKDTIIKGLEMKILELGEMTVPFEVSKNFPARETFGHRNPEHGQFRRRIVVKRITNTIKTPAIGWGVRGGFDEESLEMTEDLGWFDENLIEISVWTTTHSDRDNITELLKMWMLELEQHELEDGEPFFMGEGVAAVRFIRAYEDENHSSAQLNGPLYISSLIYEVYSRFHFRTEEEYERYKFTLISRLRECIRVDLGEQ